jgi:hypothetical protein
MPTKLEDARDSVAMLELSMKSARADLALAICDDSKQTLTEVGDKLEPLKALFKELPTRASLDNTERRRKAMKTVEELQGQIQGLKELLVAIQKDWQKDAR